MRLHEIKQAGDPIKLIDFMMRECEPWLNLTDNGEQVVYRGLDIYNTKLKELVADYPIESVFTLPIRPDRTASGSQHYRKIYNKVLSALGAVATRPNSISVTGDDDDAYKHGTPYVFLPIGEFHYTWSEQIIDWGSFSLADPNEFTEFRRNLEFQRYVDGKDPAITTFEDAVEEYITPTIIFDKFNSVSLQMAIQSNHEIAIHASHGLYIDPTLYKELLRT